MKKPRIVEVEWDDHSFAEDAKHAGIVRVRSVGYVVKDTKKELRLAQSWGVEGPAEVLTVGKAMLRKVRRT